MCPSCHRGNVHSKITETAVKLADHSRQAASTTASAWPVLSQPRKITDFSSLQRPASPATCKHVLLLTVKKGNVRSLQKVIKINFNGHT